MKILLIGSGGREHTLAWKIAQSPRADKIFAIPGNPGMKDFCECVDGISILDNDAILKFVQENQIDFVVIGPEAPLVNGLVDFLDSHGIRSFGASRLAAEIEGSKSFAKNLMKKYLIPTAQYEIFDNADRAKEYIRTQKLPIVVKADGLAAGKGVIIAETLDDALNAVDEIMTQKSFGEAGSKIVVEEFMDGEEASLLAFTDGKTIVPMISSQDHKRALDGDLGLNTGGMGSYAPAPVMTPELIDQATKKILEPTIQAMAQEGREYRGCLYAGLMIVDGIAKVVEFNCRFGDPETQVVLPLLESDLLEIMISCAEGKLDSQKIEWSSDSAVCIVLTAGGYPKSYRKGDAIDGIERARSLGTLVFHAGTKEIDSKKFATNGGRVLDVVAKSDSIEKAIDLAYKAVGAISFDGMHYRKDIAHRALERLEKLKNV